MRLMYLLTKNYKSQYEYNFLLLLSFVLIAFSFYALIKSSKYITISPELSVPTRIQEKIVSIVITPAPIVKKQEVKVIKPKPIKKIVKKKVIKKTLPLKTVPVVEPVVESVVVPVAEPIEPIVEKTEVIKVTPKPVVVKPRLPVFDAQMKASFIAGLYEMLNEKKYYPKMAKRRKLEGIVHISFTLCKDGKIENIFLHKSCGHKILDKAALKVVKSIDDYRAIPDAVSMASLNLNIPIRYSRN